MTEKNPVNVLEAVFWAYHKERPDIYELFDKHAKELVSRGYSRGSANMLFHLIRWHTMEDYKSGHTFKIKNDMAPYYARLWMKKNPKHNKLFRIAKLTADKIQD